MGYLYRKLESMQDIEKAKTEMAKGNYPIMSDCEVVGIYGDCGFECPVFLAGECEYEEEMQEHQDYKEKK